MIFKNVKGLTLPNGNAVKLSVVDKTLWRKTKKYKNWLPFATNADRKTIMNGVGYKEGYRLSSSSGGETAQKGMCVSGLMFPCKVGDVVRIKGVKPKQGTASYVMTFNSANTKVGALSLLQHTDGSDWASKTEAVYENGILTVELNSSTFGTGFDAFRFSAGVIDENTIVTINEEITE
ncbi:MAG: hypothetical protein IKU47_08415 [Oscillospiraceae bacterium]|nr:hypothetical protein [Oscillospiraceae bacterium]